MFGDTRKHAWTYFFSIVESEGKIRLTFFF